MGNIQPETFKVKVTNYNWKIKKNRHILLTMSAWMEQAKGSTQSCRQRVITILGGYLFTKLGPVKELHVRLVIPLKKITL